MKIWSYLFIKLWARIHPYPTMVVGLLSDGIYLYKVAYLWEKWESILVLCVSGGIKIIVILKWEKIRSVLIFWGLIDGRNMFPEGSLIFSMLLVGGFDFPLFNMHLFDLECPNLLNWVLYWLLSVSFFSTLNVTLNSTINNTMLF